MPIDQAYVKLRELLDIHPCGCPEAPEIYEILAILYSEAEARVAGGMAFVPRTAEVIAEKTAMDPREVRAHLESLADKGLVYAREKEGERGYALFPIMPGVFEFPLMRGEHNETTERLAGSWRAYFPRLSQSFGSENMRFSRVIPIQEEVESIPGILTYEMLDRMIDAAKSVGIGHCACREANRKCDAPREACMLFDETCDFLVERGHGRYLSKEEMKRKLREFDEAGLVRRDAAPEPADTARDMGIRILEDKGRMQDFLELNLG